MKPNPHPPIGKLINVSTHRLHIYPTGIGSPTVVLEAGGISWCLDWYLVQTKVEKFTQVCSYDRAGFGWSDPGPKPRTSEQIVSELNLLLARAKIQPPYILVGASFGGHTARLYAHKYPDEVAGVILVDARHEGLSTCMPPAWRTTEKSGEGMLRGMLMASRIGALKHLGRLMGEKAAPPVLEKLPKELRPIYLEVGFQPKFFQANLDEYSAIAESDRQMRSTGTLGEIPITVIRHGLPEMFSSMPKDQARHAEQVWQGLQAELAGLSSKSRLLVAENSGHQIPIEQPDLVVDSIRQMVETIRRFPSAVKSL